MVRSLKVGTVASCVCLAIFRFLCRSFSLLFRIAYLLLSLIYCNKLKRAKTGVVLLF